jgi:hypothetical protein
MYICFQEITITMKLDLIKFQKWLEQGGCDILPTTNQFEALKFKGKIIGIVYKSGKTSNKYTARAIKFFQQGKKWDGYPTNQGRKTSYRREKEQILERDGTLCFFCNKELGDDITLEHLLALSRGGRNLLPNMVLMHEKCNNRLSNLPLIDKINLIKEQCLKSQL